MEDTKRPHVVVIGGGFGGLAAVHGLRAAAVDVTLIDRQAYNTFQPLLYQVATGGLNPGDITYFLRSMSARQRNARYRKGTVEQVDPAAHSLRLDSGVALSYDYLIVATGVTTNYFGIPGAAEHAMAMYTRTQALAVRDQVFATLETAAADGHPKELRIVVVGGGATGVEMAGALAELRNHAAEKIYPELDREQIHITLVEMMDALLTPFAPRLRSYAYRQLERRGVDLRLSTPVREVRAESVVAGDSEEIPADVVVWATGVRAPDAVAGWGVPQDKGGRILVDADLRVRGLRDVFAVGDIAATPDPLAQLAQPAIQGGRHAAHQITALMAGRQTRPFHYRDKGTMATIGRSAAVADIAALPLPLPKLTGFVAWMIWLVVHIMSLLGNRNRLATIVNLSVRYLSWPRTFNVIVGDVPTPPSRDG